MDYRVFTKTHHGSLLQQGLNRTWHLIPIPAPHPYPSFPHLLTVPLDGPKAPATAPAPRSHHSSAAHHDHHVYLTGVPELPPGLKGHQPQDQPGAHASYVYLSMSYYFDHVALKNFAKYFLHQPHEDRECAEKLMKLQNEQSGRIFLQNTKKPHCDDWQNELNVMECALYLGKSVNQSLLDLYKLATDKK